MANIYGTSSNDNNSFQGTWPYFAYYPELVGTFPHTCNIATLES